LSVVSVGFISFLLFGNYVGHSYFNTLSETETHRAVDHIEDELNSYEMFLKNIDTSVTSFKNEFTVDEFNEMVNKFVTEESSFELLYYAPSGIIKNVYPFEEHADLIDFDIISDFNYIDRYAFNTAVDEDIVFSRVHSSDDSNYITLIKPIFINDRFEGIVGIKLDDSSIESIGSSYKSDRYDLNIFRDEDMVFFGSYGEENNIGNYGKTELLNLDLKILLTPKQNARINDLVFMGIFVVTLIGFFGVSVVFALKESNRKERLIQKLNYQNDYDQQTGILNTRRLYSDGEQLIEDNVEFYFAFGSINNLKFIYDKFGHTIGEDIVKKVSDLINRILPSKVSFYRYGGDEYSLIFKDSKRGEVINIIKKIMTIFDSEIIIDKARANISVSFGISHFPSDGNKLELLIKNAHITLSRVKAFSRNSFEFFKKSNDSRLMYDQDFDNYISSFSINQFETYLMPVIETKTNIITGFECLSRVKDKNGEHLNIFEVITSFERNGRIQELDEQVFKNMISMKQLLNKKYKRDIFLSANVSALSFNDDFVDKVIRLFKKAKLEYSTIILELTESYKVDDFEYLIKLFSKLNNAGIKIAIDDFGTGYSSLNYISKFPLYAIKIDKNM